MGWMFLAAGVLVAVVGIFAELRYTNLPDNFRHRHRTGHPFIRDRDRDTWYATGLL